VPDRLEQRIAIRYLNIGGVRDLVDQYGNAYQSAVRRERREGPQFLGPRGFVGDSSFRENHHTANMDVHVFSLDRYPYYEALAGKTLPIPTFGGNSSVSGGIETEVCVGDLYRAGSALIDVSQPTERCPTPGRNAEVAHLLRWIQQSFYTGYYLRVVEPGWISPDDELVLQERRYPHWTVDRVTRTVFEHIGDDGPYEELLLLPLLSSDWKNRMRVLRARWFVRQQNATIRIS